MRLHLERRTELGLRALHLLDEIPGVTPAKELAPRLHTSAQYLPHVMKPLVRSGWVRSEPGPTGGYALTCDISAISVLELIQLFEGDPDDGACVLRGGPCEQFDRCALHLPWVEARAALTERLGAILISDTKPQGGID